MSIPPVYDLVIKNGLVVLPDRIARTDVAVQGEAIAAVGEALAGRQELDAAGRYVIPGAVDVHVHLQMPIGRFTSTDNFHDGTRAAAFGGTTAIVDFVETGPDETMVEAIAARRALADPQVTIDYGLHMTIGPDDIRRLDQVAAAREAGCYSFKLYMAYGLRLLDGELLQAMQAVRDVAGLPVIHAENWEIITTLIAANLRAGRTSPHWHPRSRPASFEAEAAGRAIDIAAYAGTPLYIFHVSCAATVERIAAAKAQGLAITAETCPQYLALDQSVYDRDGVAGALPVCSPPLRPPADQAALWQALADGALDVVSTDHCPFTAAEKAYGLEQNDFSQIPGGVPSIESRLALVHDGLVARRPEHVSLETAVRRWVDVCCTTPAELLGFRRKGQIAPGMDADIVIFDSEQTRTITSSSLHETAGWTPYDSRTVHGWPVATLSRGELIVEGEAWLGRPGRGHFVVR